MSINVNVTGNPVSIRRGTMVTADPDYAKKEFEKRRRIRLEQVRQQSKDIAEDIRNKVRREKSKQLSDIEKKGEKELKKWQARKLLVLQQQYQECLKDIGLGHMQATIEEESDNAVELRKENYNEIAKKRGQEAFQKLQNKHQKEQSDKAMCHQRKTYNRAIENSRSKMVAQLNKNKYINSPFKKKKRKKVLTDINISSRLTGGSASETEVPNFLNISSSDSSSGSNSPSKSKNKKVRDYTPYSVGSSTYTALTDQPRLHEISENQSETEIKRTVRQHNGNHDDDENTRIENHYPSSPSRQDLENRGRRTVASYPIDTRISDRIKRRTFRSDSCRPCGNICDNMPENYVQNKSNIVHEDLSLKNTMYVTEPEEPEDLPKRYSGSAKQNLPTGSNLRETTKLNPEKKGGDSKFSSVKNPKEDIPSKPTVTLRTKRDTATVSRPKSPPISGSSNKVQYYDHKNRFFKEYIPDNSNVQKINEDSIEVCPSTGSEAEYLDRIYKRDREAQLRGKKALEKEKVHKDYQDMMQQLPKLQKQERIASIPAHKSTFHMSEDRLKEYENKKQNRMENAYEKLFPRTNVVTIPPKVQSKNARDSIDFKSYPPVLNVGSWDYNSKQKPVPVVIPTNVQSELIREAMKEVPNEPSDSESVARRRAQLQEMLSSITLQRNKLAEELSALPENSDLRKISDDLTNIDGLIRIGQRLSNSTVHSSSRKRSHSKKRRSKKNERIVSSTNSSPTSGGKNSLKENRDGSPQGRERKISKYHAHCGTDPCPASPPPLKSKSPKKVKPKAKSKQSAPLVLQNISTQTTPVAQKKGEPEKKVQATSTGDFGTAPLGSAANICTNATRFPCNCCRCIKIDKADQCEIIIKIDDNGKPQICLSPTRLKDRKIIVKTQDLRDTANTFQLESEIKSQEAKSDKSVESETVPEKPASKIYEQQKPEKGPKVVRPCKSIKCVKPETVSKPAVTQKPEQEKTTERKSKSKNIPDSHRRDGSVSWREYLSQNSSNSSTVYLSPPDFTKAVQNPHIYNQKPKESKSQPGGYLSSILRDRPQQNNLQDDYIGYEIPSPRGIPNPVIFNYIKALLSMSRASIDELAVSSVSEVTTPGSSIINIQTNRSKKQLYGILKHLNLNPSDVDQYLSYSSDSNRHYNTSESASSTSRSGESKYDDSRGVIVQPAMSFEDIRDKTLDAYCAEKYPGVLTAYNKLAENCAKRIENLAAMIEKVRLDKLNIMHSPGSGSDKENSTKYLDLPAEFKKSPDQVDEKHISSGNSSDQEELNRLLLDVDYDFAEQLKGMTADEIREKFPLNDNDNNHIVKEGSGQRNSVDDELMMRFRNLLESHKKDEASVSGSPKTIEQETNIPEKDNNSFVPLLDDIPRLPKYTASDVSDNLHQGNGRSKPPPSKGLIIAKRFNNNIDNVPHELSTILETDGSKLHTSKTVDSQASGLNISRTELIPMVNLSSDDNTDQRVSSGKSLPDIVTEVQDSAPQVHIQKCNPQTCPNISKKASGDLASDSSASDLDNMEAVLKSLGMGWAIATLRKTQEALALTSSSSSVDVNLKQREVKLTSDSSTSLTSDTNSEVKNILGKPSLSSSSGSSPFIKELQDISAIPGSSGSFERHTQRTSTPIQATKTTADNSKNESQPRIILSGESEVSVVKEPSEISCNCVPFYSLEEESSIKS